MTTLEHRTDRLRRWMFEDALYLWWTVGADRHEGGFHEAIDQDGCPHRAVRRVRVQARQTWVYATAGALGWDGPWRVAMEHGLDFLLRGFARTDGLFAPTAAIGGRCSESAPLLYDQAFVLLALAAVVQVEAGRSDLRARAGSLLETIEDIHGHDGRGFREASAEHPFHANPHMHLLEAALAWATIDPSPVWDNLADRVAGLCLQAFVEPKFGSVREYFDGQWTPVAEPWGRIVEPGHQFEWAWLLGRLAVRRGNPGAWAAAERLFEVGSRFGVDALRGVTFNSMNDEMLPVDLTARLWPQTERIKAAVSLASEASDHGTRAELLTQASGGIDALERYLDAAVRGAWWDKMTPTGLFINEPAPATSFCHIVGAILALSARFPAPA